MTKRNTLAAMVIVLAISLLAVACSTPQAAPATPTMDANGIYTQAAQTVQAGIDQTNAVKPTVPPTETPAPTSTMDPVISAGLTSTAKAVLQPGTAATPTLGAGQPTLSLTKQATLPVATVAVVAPPPKASGDKAELVGQSPTDGASVQKAATFTNTIVLKNIGTTTWSTRYALVFYAGDQMGSPNDFNMPNEVKPGETVKLVFDMKAPDSTGKKKVIWAVRNADGVNFYDLWLEMNITE